MSTAPEARVVVLVVCPRCQREGTGPGVIGAVNEVITATETHLAYSSDGIDRAAQLGLNRAVKIAGAWFTTNDGTNVEVHRVMVGCRHGTRGLELDQLDRALRRPRKNGRATVLVSEPDVR